MAFKPTKDNVIVKPEASSNVSKGGLILVSSQLPVEFGVVISVGVNVTDVKKDDRVIYYPRSGSTITDDGTLIMKETSVLAVVDAT